MRPLHAPSTERALARLTRRVRNLERRGPSPWHVVGATGEPAFQNSWAAEGSGAVPPRFRWTLGAGLEIQGAFTGGSYGTVAFTLPSGYLPDYVMYLAGSDADNNPITFKIDTTGDVTIYAGSFPDGSVTGAKLEDSGVAAGTYGDATHVAQVTVDAKGRVTAASDVAITGGSGDVATDTIWAAKGDLAVGTGADTAAVETVGANNTVLVADSAQTTGVKWVQVGEAMIALADVTTDNVTSSAHGFAPKSPADATKFLNGATTPAYAQVKDSDLSTSDITTNDVSTSKHGFAPKAPSDATKYLDGTGAWSVPAGGGGSGAAWTRIVTESGASFADFNVSTGTWASNGTVIQQTNPATGTFFFCKLGTALPIPYIAQVEFLIPSSGADSSQSDEHVGIVCGVTALGTGSGRPIVRAQGGSLSGNNGEIELNTTSARVSTAIPWTFFDTWHTIRLIFTGGAITGWLNGTLIGTAGNIATNIDSNAGYLGLLTFNVKANFRNLKVWSFDLSSLP